MCRGEIRNSKSETRTKLEIRSSNTSLRLSRDRLRVYWPFEFRHSNLFRNSDFGFRILIPVAAETMIDCERLTRRFGHFTAVDHVSFKVAKGSIFGFLGPNGSGKSTVIRMLCGLLEPSDGRAAIAGFDVANQTEQIKHLIDRKST